LISCFSDQIQDRVWSDPRTHPVEWEPAVEPLCRHLDSGEPADDYPEDSEPLQLILRGWLVCKSFPSVIGR
jgi:hypothetical protein